MSISQTFSHNFCKLQVELFSFSVIFCSKLHFGVFARHKKETLTGNESVEQRYYSIIHLMKNTTSNSPFVALYPYELYYSKGQVQKLDTFFNLKSQTKCCGALRDWIPFVRFGGGAPMGGRCCWWGCGLGALESAIAFFGHSHGGALLLVGLWAGGFGICYSFF